LLRSTTNESVKAVRLEFLKRTRERKLRKVILGLCRNCGIQCHPSPWANSPVAIPRPQK